MEDSISLEEFLDSVPHLNEDSMMDDVIHELVSRGMELSFVDKPVQEWDTDENK